MRCPVCRADTAGPSCRRCKADLTLLISLEDQHLRALTTARREAVRGAWVAAETAAAHAGDLRGDCAAGTLLASLRLLQGDFASAWHAYRQLQRLGSKAGA